MRLPVPAAPYSGDGLEVAFGPDERGQVQAYLHTGTETIVLYWDASQASWVGTLADGRSFQVIPAMVVIARPADETKPMLWRKLVM
jgi:YD repeat-containing protein